MNRMSGDAVDALIYLRRSDLAGAALDLLADEDYEQAIDLIETLRDQIKAAVESFHDGRRMYSTEVPFTRAALHSYVDPAGRECVIRVEHPLSPDGAPSDPGVGSQWID